jgi:hypothetical protein
MSDRSWYATDQPQPRCWLWPPVPGTPLASDSVHAHVHASTAHVSVIAVLVLEFLQVMSMEIRKLVVRMLRMLCVYWGATA